MVVGAEEGVQQQELNNNVRDVQDLHGDVETEQVVTGQLRDAVPRVRVRRVSRVSAQLHEESTHGLDEVAHDLVCALRVGLALTLYGRVGYGVHGDARLLVEDTPKGAR